MHIPVMVPEVLEYLAIRPDGNYVDDTAGLGGHTREIARRLTTGFVLAIDRDPESLAMAQQSLAEFGERIRYRQSDFSTLPQALAEERLERVDGLLADLGVSRYQLTDAQRGFSILSDG